MIIHKALRNTLGFLEENQLPDGSFESVTGKDCLEKNITSDNNVTSYTTFHTSLILSCLKGLDKENIIIQKGLDFLLDQRRNDWSWTYWRRGTNKFPPPDFDDTACALIALSIHAPHKITGETFSHITQSLIQAETAEGGPYNTWIIPKEIREKWQDIDIVVNSNIAYFLHLQDIHLPQLIEYLENATDLLLSSKTFYSCYYKSIPVIFYFISRVHTSSKKSLIKNKLISLATNGLWQNDLETALCVSTLIRCDCNKKDIAVAVAHLTSVAEEKNWKAYPLYTEEYIECAHYSGGKATTASFIFEALSLFYTFNQCDKKYADTESNSIKSAVIEKTESIFTNNACLRAMIVQDTKNQITLLPYYFNNGLCALLQKPDTFTKIVDLGSANLAGWIAYRTYDNILDREIAAKNTIENLPNANKALMHVVSTYHDILPKKYWNIFRKILQDIENANIWENTETFIRNSMGIISIEHIPDYKDYSVLADKSFGHALGPLSILLLCGHDIMSAAFTQTCIFFKNYLIARQLNDDAHDWLSDLERGFLNSVSVNIMQIWKERYLQDTVDVQEQKENLQKIFWTKTIDTISEKIITHVNYARDALQNNPAIKNTSYLESLIKPLEQSAMEALIEKKRMMEFLSVYI